MKTLNSYSAAFAAQNQIAVIEFKCPGVTVEIAEKSDDLRHPLHPFKIDRQPVVQIGNNTERQQQNAAEKGDGMRQPGTPAFLLPGGADRSRRLPGPGDGARFYGPFP